MLGVYLTVFVTSSKALEQLQKFLLTLARYHGDIGLNIMSLLFQSHINATPTKSSSNLNEYNKSKNGFYINMILSLCDDDNCITRLVCVMPTCITYNNLYRIVVALRIISDTVAAGTCSNLLNIMIIALARAVWVCADKKGGEPQTSISTELFK